MPGDRSDERVLIFAPVGQDAAAVAELLHRRGLSVQICDGNSNCCIDLVREAGALLLTEEALEYPQTTPLLETLKYQPSWSELPLIILTRGGEPRAARLLELAAATAGSLTLLERPLSSATLLRSVEVALRSRRRQYEVRDLLQEQARRQVELEVANAAARKELAERQRAEESLAQRIREQGALYQFTDQLQRAGSLEEVYNSALDAIESALDCRRASILRFDQAGVMRFLAWRGLTDGYRQAVEGHSPWQVGAKDPRPIAIDDVDESNFPPELKSTMREEGICALAFIPLVEGGKLVGKFMTYYDAPHRFAASELELALTLARQIGFGLERKRAEDARARLAAIVESSEDAILSQGLDAVITSWNRGAERLFGFTAEEAVGQPITIIIPKELQDEEPRIQARIRSGHGVEHFETLRRCKDGRLLDISLTVSPITDAQGKVIGASKIARDITERKRAEQALQESEERYRTLVSQVKDYAIFSTDLEGRPTSWNEGVRRVLGFEESEFLGRDIKSIFTPEDIAAGVPDRELRRAAKVGRASNDRWLRRADGKRFFAMGATTALRNSARELVGYTKVLRDNTALAEARSKLEAHAIELERMIAVRTKDLQATNEQLEAFVYSIAHDLRTPLRTVTGYSQLLQEDYGSQLDDTAKQLLRRVHNAAEFMDKLLLDLLAFGRTARAQIELGPVETQKAWEVALFQCASQIEQSQALVEAVTPLPAVIAHEATLGQCLANLLSNALKFIEPGVRPKVNLRAEERGGAVRLWIEDNGLGIPPDQRDRVFRVFERLHGSLYSGTGIGLSIVRKGVERMGGTVGVESEPGKGSRFWIELPKAR